jgi:hypothetical protein
MQNFSFRFKIKLHFTVVSSKHMIQSETLVKKTHSKMQALRALVDYIRFFRPQKERFVVQVPTLWTESKMAYSIKRQCLVESLGRHNDDR